MAHFQVRGYVRDPEPVKRTSWTSEPLEISTSATKARPDRPSSNVRSSGLPAVNFSERGAQNCPCHDVRPEGPVTVSMSTSTPSMGLSPLRSILAKREIKSPPGPAGRGILVSVDSFAISNFTDETRPKSACDFHDALNPLGYEAS